MNGFSKLCTNVGQYLGVTDYESVEKEFPFHLKRNEKVNIFLK